MGSAVAPLLLIAALAGPAVALPDLCVLGTPVGCDDGNPCTADLCQLGGCVHTPLVGAPCDDGNACTVGDHCDAGQCVGVPITCPDDGFTCTDDVCIDGGCVHVPVDSRCVRAGECSDAMCAPERPDHDGAGCVGGAARSEGQECSEDGDACTVDQCHGGECAHQAVVDPRSCVAVRDVYRQALALASLVRGIAALLGHPRRRRRGHAPRPPGAPQLARAARRAPAAPSGDRHLRPLSAGAAVPSSVRLSSRTCPGGSASAPR